MIKKSIQLYTHEFTNSSTVLYCLSLDFQLLFHAKKNQNIAALNESAKPIRYIEIENELKFLVDRKTNRKMKEYVLNTSRKRSRKQRTMGINEIILTIIYSKLDKIK